MTHTFHIAGDWLILDGERGVAPTVRAAAALGAGELLRSPRQSPRGGRQWAVHWESTEGATLLLGVEPYSVTDAQLHTYILHLPDGTGVEYVLVDACSMSQIDFVVTPGTLPVEHVEAALRDAFELF